MYKYQNIKNLRDLQLERIRVAEKLEYKKREISRRYSAMRYVFSLEGLTNYLTSQLKSGMSLLEFVYQGYNYARDIISKIRSRRASED